MEVLYELLDKLKAETIDLISRKKAATSHDMRNYYNGSITQNEAIIKEIENRLMEMTI